MKRIIAFTLLMVTFGLFNNNVQAQQFKNPDFVWGVTTGAVHGSNVNGDRWGMQYRAFLQMEVISPMLVGQIGLGYASLLAPRVYTAETGIADFRLHLSPFVIQNLNPYLYAGAALTKSLNVNNSDYLPMVLFGAGLQTKIARGAMLDLTGGFNLSISDDFDGRTRSAANLNPITNERQDGFYGFTLGLAFAI